MLAQIQQRSCGAILRSATRDRLRTGHSTQADYLVRWSIILYGFGFFAVAWQKYSDV